MTCESDRSRTRRIFWGALLMALGGAFLLDRIGVVDLPSVWRVWPLVLLVIGGIQVFERRPGSGIMLALLGLSFFAAEFHWVGLSYHSFWPLLVVAVGVGIVIKAISREDDECRCEEVSHE